jgi:hypothetical protein
MTNLRNRTPWLLRALLAIATVILLPTASVNADDAEQGSALVNPNAHFRGKTVAEWSLLHNEWAIATGLGQGSEIPNTVNGMRFLPPGFGSGDFEFDLVIAPGTGIVSSPFFAFGELYEDETFDDPEDPFLVFLLDLIFQERMIAVWLDGKLVQSGTPAELSGFTYGPTFFDAPIPYAEPQDRGDISAVAALWTVGVGGVYAPLPPGKHTLVVMSDGPVFGPNSFTYNITVGQ